MYTHIYVYKHSNQFFSAKLLYVSIYPQIIRHLKVPNMIDKHKQANIGKQLEVNNLCKERGKEMVDIFREKRGVISSLT